MPEPSAKSKEKQKIPFFSRLQVKYALSYLALLAMGLELPADLVAIAFGVVGIFNSLSVLEGRRRNREDVSYNLLWGQLALTIFLVACAVLAIRQRLGL